MGSPLSPVIADVVLQDLEEKTLKKINVNISFYHRYVDDVILAAPADQTSMILDTFNSFHNRLQFTMEFENGRELNFLDLMMKVINNTIHLDWFHKNTFSGRVLSYLSNHPHCHNTDTIYNLVDRAILLSHPSYQQKNLEFCIRLLLDIL